MPKLEIYNLNESQFYDCLYIRYYVSSLEVYPFCQSFFFFFFLLGNFVFVILVQVLSQQQGFDLFQSIYNIFGLSFRSKDHILKICYSFPHLSSHVSSGRGPGTNHTASISCIFVRSLLDENCSILHILELMDVVFPFAKLLLFHLSSNCMW